MRQHEQGSDRGIGVWGVGRSLRELDARFHISRTVLSI